LADTIDAALDMLHHTGPEYGGGLSNHGPMAAEAVLAMGRPDAILPWVGRYQYRLPEHPTPSAPMARMHRREALGDLKSLAELVTASSREPSLTEFVASASREEALHALLRGSAIGLRPVAISAPRW
jgi:hypothetical protein